MGGVSKMVKNNLDPANLFHNKDQPRTLSNYVKSAHNMGDPFGANLGAAIGQHNNTQDNLRGTMDPGQLFGSNATTAAPYNPSTYQVAGGTGVNPQLGMPANGISTNGIGSTGYTNGLNGGVATNGMPGQQPDWGAIIARAMRK